MLRRVRLAAVLMAAAVPALPANAATEAKFEPAAFAAAQAAGKPILSRLGADPANKDLVRFVVDFDGQRDALRALNVRSRSTLIAFRGAEEKARSVGVTDEAQIKALVEKTRR